MKTATSIAQIGIPRRRIRQEGFTLVELLIAVAMFTVVSGAAFSLLAQHQPIFNQQQNLAEVNIALRNAIAQMQIDIGNAGANYYATTNIPNYPVGVTITNHPIASGGDCRTGTPKVYGANCFDQMSIITADIATPPLNPSVNPITAGGDTNCSTPTNTRTLNGNGFLYLIPPTGYSAAQITTLAGQYKSGDQILYVSNSGAFYTTAVLSANGATVTASGKTYVKLAPGATTTSGTTSGFNSSTTNDPTSMTTAVNSSLGETYCSTDWVLRLVPITYKVDTTTNSNNPALLRTVAGLTQTTAQQTLATQVIGLKIGAVLFEGGTTDSPTYCFDSTQYDSNCLSPTSTPPSYKNNYTVVRSVMVSLVGRTNPNPGPSYVFRNTFDSGPYEIQGVSVVINPRNMSF